MCFMLALEALITSFPTAELYLVSFIHGVS